VGHTSGKRQYPSRNFLNSVTCRLDSAAFKGETAPGRPLGNGDGNAAR
jgi:hypothetical protein